MEKIVLCKVSGDECLVFDFSWFAYDV